MDCSPPGSSIHGIPRAGLLEWVASPFSRSSQHRDEPEIPALQAGALPSEPPGKPYNICKYKKIYSKNIYKYIIYVLDCTRVNTSLQW